MPKEKKIDTRNIICLILIFLFVVFLLTKGKFLYGATLDWQTQHWTFAEYFRNLFYQTHKLFPSFAFNLGAGQNIYNFSYYGFLNPLILLSYFFPFIKMVTYVMLISIFGVILSIILFYRWLRKHEFSSSLSFLITFLFLCAAPLILHSHRHIMFVNYLPFLILGLNSIDLYFDQNKRCPLILCTFLIIMTSYYFSIPSLMVLVIYGIYVYLKRNNKVTVKSFFNEGFKFLIPIFIGIFMASIILFPTLYTIFMGRNSNTISISLRELILPSLNFDYLLYGSYSLGLTGIIIFAIIYGFASHKKEKVFLASIFSIITLFPLIIFVLNGFLYLNAKVLIPFLPLALYLIASFLRDLFNHQIPLKKIVICSVIISLAFYLTSTWNYRLYYLIDILLLILAFVFYYYKNQKWGVYLVLMLTSFGLMLGLNFDDELMAKKDYNYIFNEDITTLFKEIKDSSFYRSSNLVNPLVTSNKVYNENYYNTSMYSSGYNSYFKEFYVDTFANNLEYRNLLILNPVNNPLWHTYMGIKYLVHDHELNYSKINTKGNYNLYENDVVYPLGYARTSLMSEKEFKKLTYPYNIEALMKYTIVNEDVKSNFNSTLEKVDLAFNLNNENIVINKKDTYYEVKVKKTTTVDIPLERNFTNKILLIRFQNDFEQKCRDGDTYITINDVKNTLTCRSWKYKNTNATFDYALLSPSSLKITFKKGTYWLSNLETFVMDYQEIKNIIPTLMSFNINKTKTKGDVIEGNINVLEDAYFSMTLPYDEGFKIYVDNNLIDYDLTNTAFIGFPIAKGNHQIKIVYTAPLKNISLVLSGLSLIGFIIIIFIDEHKRKEER